MMLKNKKDGIFNFLNFRKKKISDNLTDQINDSTILESKEKKNINSEIAVLDQKIVDSSSNDTIDVYKNSILNKVKNKEQTTFLNMKKNFFSRLKYKFYQTSKRFSDKIISIFSKNKIDQSIFEKLEEELLMSDISISTADYIIKNVMKDIKKENFHDAYFLYSSLRKNMLNILKKVENTVDLSNSRKYPIVILLIGVNGVGKTTTIGKLSLQYKQQKKIVALVAADTFRAASVEQLEELGKNNNIPVISAFNLKSNHDPAAVVFNAIKFAYNNNIEVLIIDTAGRLHNKIYLMDELKKVVKVIKKNNFQGLNEILLVVDATIGQNSVFQIETFNKYIDIDGIILTKLDGTAKGGIVFSIANTFSIPIKYISTGEKMSDLYVFNSIDFINSMFKKIHRKDFFLIEK